jgi:hypothetical protein
MTPSALARQVGLRRGLRPVPRMNRAMDRSCADYTDKELELIAGFLQRTTEAGRNSAGKLGGQE